MPDLTVVARIRQELPATTSRIYLNAGTFGPLPIRAVEAMHQHMQRELHEGRLGAQAFEKISATYTAARQAVARLLHADEDEIVLTDNTGEGINIVSNGFHWQAGDEVITTNHEHISLLAPLYQLRNRYGIVIRILDLGPTAERSRLESLADLITSRTRLLALSHVTWTTGTRLDLNEICSLAHERGVPVLIDGAQSAGAIPLSLHASNVDFYAIPGQKWLCGPDGTGALYVRREALNTLTPTYVGYWSTEEMHAEEWRLQKDARRFEVGGRQTAAIAAQTAALTWLEQTVGHEWLFARIAELNRYAGQALSAVPGVQLLSSYPGDSGLLAFTLKDQKPDEVVAYLSEQHRISIRNIPEMNSLRISTGFYNTEEEIDTLVKALTTYRR
jgi:L-cysteine/cystine lyase